MQKNVIVNLAVANLEYRIVSLMTVIQNKLHKIVNSNVTYNK